MSSTQSHFQDPARVPARSHLVAILVLLGAVNLTTGFVLDSAAAWALQIAATLLAVGAALRAGYSRADLGLARADLASGLRMGGIAALIVVAGITVAALVPFTRDFFDNDQFVAMTGAEFTFEAVVRIPLITALTEELLFRGVLLAVLLAMTTRWRAVIYSSIAFGLWHVVVTAGDLDGNAATERLSIIQSIGSVAVVVLTTGAAGAVFAELRLRSGSLVAPWLLHTAFNVGAFTAGYILVSGGHL